MYFDGGIFWGREPKYGLEKTTTGQGMALFAHFEAIYYDMITGNNRTLEVARQNSGLLPLAVINPLRYDPNSTYLEELKQQGFRGYALLAHHQNWKMDSYAFKHLGKKLVTLGLPVQIGVASLAELRAAVDSFSESHSPVLIRWLRGGGYAAIADEIATARDCANFYFDVSNLVSIGSIKYLTNAIGSHRLYVATNAPLVYESSIQLLVDHAKLDQKDYDNITGATLERLFTGAIVGFVSASPRLPVAFNRPKIDIHWHSEGWDLMEPGATIEALHQTITECNYQAVITSSILALNYDLKAGNEATLKMVASHPRVFGYVVVDPVRANDSLAELEKYANHPRFVGIKTIQDYYGLGLDDECYETLLAWAELHRWPVLAHKAGLAQAAKKFPGVRFIAAHCSFQNFSEFKDLPNVYLDISGSFAHRGETNLAALLTAVGADRILYSSDGPLVSPWWAIGKIVDSNLEETVQEKMYRSNALRLFPKLALI